MGFRFRKSKGLGKFLRLNFTKNGVGFQVGPRRGGVRMGVSPTGQVNVGASDGRTGFSWTRRLGTVGEDATTQSADADRARHPAVVAKSQETPQQYFDRAVAAPAFDAMSLLTSVYEQPKSVRSFLIVTCGFRAEEADHFLVDYPEALRARFATERTESFDNMLKALDGLGTDDLSKLWDRMKRSPVIAVSLGLNEDERVRYAAAVLQRAATDWLPARYDDTCAITGQELAASDLVLAVVPGGYYDVVGRQFAPAAAA